MKLFLAKTSDLKKLWGYGLEKSPFILESFYYWDDWQAEQIKSCKMFIADSGAFSYISGAKSGDIKSFTEQYIRFLRKYDIEYFMEMDVDSVIGLEKVEYLRHKIEDHTGKPAIPVFHKSRGLDYWYKMCEEYDYVAVGTTFEYNSDPEVLRKLVSIANSKGVKVHGLGYTRRDAENMGFYSVDSSSWASARFGQLVRFNGEWVEKVDSGDRRLVVSSYRYHYHNLMEWIKLQKHLESKEGVRK